MAKTQRRMDALRCETGGLIGDIIIMAFIFIGAAWNVVTCPQPYQSEDSSQSVQPMGALFPCDPSPHEPPYSYEERIDNQRLCIRFPRVWIGHIFDVRLHRLAKFSIMTLAAAQFSDRGDVFHYQSIPASTSWDQSLTVCRDAGRSLASFRDRAQFEALKSWVGLSYISASDHSTTPGSMMWFSGNMLRNRADALHFTVGSRTNFLDPAIGFQWCYGEPSNDGNENSLLISGGCGYTVPTSVEMDYYRFPIQYAICVEHYCNGDDDCNGNGQTANTLWHRDVQCQCTCNPPFSGSTCWNPSFRYGNSEYILFRGPFYRPDEIQTRCLSHGAFMFPATFQNASALTDVYNAYIKNLQLTHTVGIGIYNYRVWMDGRWGSQTVEWWNAAASPYTHGGINPSGSKVGMVPKQQMRAYMCSIQHCTVEDDCAPYYGAGVSLAVNAGGLWPNCSCTVLNQNDEIVRLEYLTAFQSPTEAGNTIAANFARKIMNYNGHHGPFVKEGSYSHTNYETYRGASQLNWDTAVAICMSEPNRYPAVFRNAEQWNIFSREHSKNRAAWLGISSLTPPFIDDAANGGGGRIWRVTHGRWAGMPFFTTNTNKFGGFFSGTWGGASTSGSNSRIGADFNLDAAANESYSDWVNKRNALGASFLRATTSLYPATATPGTATPAVWCVKYRCNRNDDCHGRGEPVQNLTAAIGGITYWPDCHQCTCDPGYTGDRCETFVSQEKDIITQHRVETNPVTYAQASAVCEASGQVLASIRNKAQWSEIAAASGPSVGSSTCWFGATSLANSGGIWRWQSSPQTSRFSDVFFGTEKQLPFDFYVPWANTADYSTAAGTTRFLKIVPSNAKALTTPPSATNINFLFGGTGNAAERLDCFYCTRYICNNEDDCHGNAISVSGMWPNCECVCPLPLMGDCRTRTMSTSAMESVSASLRGSSTATKIASESQSAPQTITPTRTPSVSSSISPVATPSATAPHTPTDPQTLTVTVPVTNSKSLPAIVGTPPPHVYAPNTLSGIGYGYRYVHYSPIRPINGLISGISLLFTETYRDFHARRFLVMKRNDGLQRFPLGESRQLTRLGLPVTYMVAISMTTRTIRDAVFENDHSISGFVDIRSPYHLVQDFAYTQCGQLMTASPLKVLFAHERHDTSSGSIRLRVEPFAQYPECREGIMYAGMVYSEVPFVDATPLLSYAHMPTASNADDDVRNRLTSEDFTAEAWLGSPPTSPSAGKDELFQNTLSIDDAVLVGDFSSPTRRPTPAVYQPMAFMTPVLTTAELHVVSSADAQGNINSDNTTNPAPSSHRNVRISNTTHSTVACTVGTQTAFKALFVPSNVSLNQSLPSGCYTYDTVDDLQLACQRDNSCVGFTTIRIDSAGGLLPLEMPLCLYLGSESATSSAAASSNTSSHSMTRDTMIYPRIFYRKPPRTPAACNVSVAQSGTIAVYVQQTSMSSSDAVVSINTEVMARCGGARPFLNGFMGLDGKCAQWVLCYVGRVPVDSQITVTTSTVPTQGGCDNSLGVIVRQTSIDAVQFYREPEVPIPRLNVRGLGFRDVRKSTFHGDGAKVLVFLAQAAALDVTQTGYSCTTPGARCSDSLTNNAVIRMSTLSSCQSCGGRKGFYTGRTGMSDRCDTYQFCDDFLPLASSTDGGNCEENALRPPSRPYFGTITIDANVSELSTVGGLCELFLGRVYAASPSSLGNIEGGAPSDTTSPMPIPIFPLITMTAHSGTSSSVIFNTLLGAPLSASTNRLATIAGVVPAAAYAYITQIATVGPLNAPIGAYYIPWRQLYGVGVPIQERIHRNSSQVCIVDHSMEEVVQCTFYIPRGSTHMKVLAAQTDFVEQQLEVRVLLDGETLSSTDRCGAKHLFGRQKGQQEQCDVYLACANRFLYRNDSLAETSSNGVVVITVPAEMRNRQCDFIASIIVEFSNPLQGPAECNNQTEYECPGERRCIPQSYMCDGIQDCEGNSDEHGCKQLVSLPGEALCIGREFFTGIDIPNGSMEECKRFAAQNDATFFTLNGTRCSAVLSSVTPSVISSIESFICDAPGAESVVAVDDRAGFGICRATVQCYGHGAAYTTSSGSCVCECAAGFQGTHCTDAVSLDGITSIVCILKQNASLVGALSEINLRVVASAVLLGNARTLSAQCDVLATELSGHVQVGCTITSRQKRAFEVAAHYRRLLQPYSQDSVARALRDADHPELLYITTRTTMTPTIVLPRCERGEDSIRCNMSGITPDRLRLLIQEDLPVTTAVVTFGSSSMTSRQFQSHSVGESHTIQCAMASTNTDGGCVSSSCDIPAITTADKGDQIIVSVTNITFAAATVFSARCVDPHTSVAALHILGNVNVSTSSVVTNVETNYIIYFVIGLVLVASPVAGWISAVILYRRFTAQRALLEEALIPSVYREAVRRTTLSFNCPRGVISSTDNDSAGVLLDSPRSLRPSTGFVLPELANANDGTEDRQKQEANDQSIGDAPLALIHVESVPLNSFSRGAQSESLEIETAASNAKILLDAMKTRMLVRLFHLRGAPSSPGEGHDSASSICPVKGAGDGNFDIHCVENANEIPSPGVTVGPADAKSIPPVFAASSGISQVRLDRLSTAISAASAVVAVVAGFLILLYATSYKLNSDFAVLYEEYTDELCSDSAASPMPRRLFAVPPGTTECEPMQITGEAVGAVFASGKCDGGNGEYVAAFRMSSSLHTCRVVSAVRTYKSGECLKMSDVDPLSSKVSFVKITCSDAALIERRTSELEVLTGRVDTFVHGELMDPPIRTVPANSGLADNRRPYLAGSDRWESSSVAPAHTISAVASFAHLTTDLAALLVDDPRKIILQAPECLFNASADVSCSSEYEANAAAQLMVASLDYDEDDKKALGAVSSTSRQSPDDIRTTQLKKRRSPPIMFGPSSSDVPAGHLYGGYGTSQDTTWEAAGASAHRYYQVYHSLFDMGAFFPANREDPSDDEGYAVSLWLRADRNTRGFAFAVTDAFEDIETLQVHPLDRLAGIIDSGAGGSAWFNTTYRVYNSLYVNGPSRSLTVAYARPPIQRDGEESKATSSAVTLLHFDLQEINSVDLLNSQWHHVAVTFLVENGRVRAQLVIDGRSSTTSAGWGTCVSNLPEAIRLHPISDTPPKSGGGSSLRQTNVFNHLTDRVLSGGLLVVGYFNGGVGLLKAHGTRMEAIQFLPMGTTTMREAHRYPLNETLGLGITLVIIAVLLLGIVIISGKREIKEMRSTSSAGSYRELAVRLYVHIAQASIFERERRVIKLANNLRKQKPSCEPQEIEREIESARRLLSTVQFQPIRLWTTLRWTQLSVEELGILLDEVESQVQGIEQQGHAVLSLIYKLKTNSPGVKRVTVGMWNVIARGDARAADPLIDRQRCGGKDLFQEHVYANKKGQPFGHKSRRSNYELMNVLNEDDGTSEDSFEADDAKRHRSVKSMNRSDGGHSVKIGKVDLLLPQFGTDSVSSTTIPTPAPSGSGIGDVLSPVIGVFQSMFVWSTSIALPSLYDSYFGEFFSFFSVDFATTFPSIPTLATPVIQIAAGLIMIGVVVYFLFEDHREFETCLTKYVWKRDESDGIQPPRAVESFNTKSRSEILLSTLAPRHSLTTPDHIHALPVAQSTRIEQMIQAAKKKESAEEEVKEDTPTKNQNEQEMEKLEPVVDVGGDTLSIAKGINGQHHVGFTNLNSDGITIASKYTVYYDTEKKTLRAVDEASPPIEQPPGTSNGNTHHQQHFEVPRDDGAPYWGPSLPIEEASACCVIHNKRVLGSIMQTDIWPFSNRVKCCVSVGGIPCGKNMGVMFACGADCGEGETGINTKALSDAIQIKKCGFAVCAAHFRPSIVELVRSLIVSEIRRLGSQGPMWLCCAVSLMLAGIAYVPFLKTALMIVSCHPYYQCEFEHCWEDPDQKFVIAAFLSIVVIIMLGIGYPITLFGILLHRKSLVKRIFLDEGYGGKYSVGQDQRRKKGEDSSTRDVGIGEWMRFVSSDTSAGVSQYKNLHPNLLYLPSLTLALNAVALVPALFAEPHSFNQRLGCSIVELFTTLLIFTTKAYLSPVTHLTLRVARIHQLVILGLQNLDLYFQNNIVDPSPSAANGTEDSTTTPVSYVMLVATFAYIVFSGIALVLVLGWPVISTVISQRKMTKILKRHGYTDSQTAPLYMWPTPIRVLLEAEENESSDHGKDGHSAAAAPNSISKSAMDFLTRATAPKLPKAPQWPMDTATRSKKNNRSVCKRQVTITNVSTSSEDLPSSDSESPQNAINPLECIPNEPPHVFAQLVHGRKSFDSEAQRISPNNLNVPPKPSDVELIAPHHPSAVQCEHYELTN